jgi:non-specific protein-tyrosine kinase
MTTEMMRASENNIQTNVDVTSIIRRNSSLLWQWAWLILLISLVMGGSAFYFSRKMTAIYKTSTKILVITAANNRPTDYNSIMASTQLTSTYADMLTNEAVLQQVIKQLNLATTPQVLANSIQVAPVRDTQLIGITVQGSNPAQIADIANTMVAIFIDRIQSIQSTSYAASKQNLSDQLAAINQTLLDTKAKIANVTDPAEKDRLEAQVVQYQQIYATLLTTYEQARLSEAQSFSNVAQVNLAQPPLTPVGPNVMLNTLLAALMGVLLSAGAIFGLDALDDTVRTPEQVSKLLGLPVLGVILHHKVGAQLVTQGEPRSQTAESFRLLRTNVQYANIDKPLRKLMVTSPLPGEGKSLVSSNLAVILAQAGRRVALVDADLHHPTIHKLLNIPNEIGMTTVLLQPVLNLDEVMKNTNIRGFSFMPSGDLPPNPAELLGSIKMGQLLEKLVEGVDTVVIDTPPVLQVADPLVLATKVDGVILVLKSGETKASAAKDAVERLMQVNAHIIGVVLNNVNIKSSRYRYYYHYGTKI